MHLVLLTRIDFVQFFVVVYVYVVIDMYFSIFLHQYYLLFRNAYSDSCAFIYTLHIHMYIHNMYVDIVIIHVFVLYIFIPVKNIDRNTLYCLFFYFVFIFF